MLDKILSFLGGVVKPITDLIDDMHTSDEEKDTIKAQIISILSKADADLDKEVTARHKTDMTSDSWLSKNIRPLTLVFTVIATFGLIYSTVFILDKEEVSLVQPWIPLLTAILTTEIIFYFGSRGLEKRAKIKANGNG